MKKQLYILYLLLLSVQLAIAQTTRYEYWLDNDHEDRTVVANNVTDVALDLDISSLKPGLHYFNFRAQGDSGQWGGMSRYLFYIKEVADTTAAFMTQYEYWLDNQHEVRTAVKGSTSEVPLDLDISSLKPGLHYFNFRAQGKSGRWGGLSRYLFYIRDNADATAGSMTQYEYWLDNNFNERTVVNGATTDIPLDVDISSLKPGLHYFNFRAQGKSGQWGGLSRYLFYVKQGGLGQGQLANIEYWIDERQDVKTQQVTDSTVVITVDITNLPVGRHSFNLEGRTSSGYSGLLASYEFVNSELPVLPDPVISHEGNIITITAAPDSTLADSLVVNPTYYYTLDGTMPDTTSIKYVGPFEVTENCVVKAIGMQRGFMDSRVDSLVVDWFKVETPTFRFEYMYDMDLTIETETDDAEIYYTLNGRMLEGDDTNFGYNTLSRYNKWSVWGDNKQAAKTERSGYNGSYCLMFTSKENGSFESAQAGYKFTRALTEGDYYTIRFMARSKSGNGKLQFYCQNDTLPNTRSAADTLTIGSEFADYEVTVKIDNDKTNQFVLNFGAVADTYYIDNVLFGPVISDTTNQLRTLYERPIELRQGVTIKAVAVKQGMKDSEPAVWDYFYEGWMNMLETYERCRMICDMVVGDPNVPLMMVNDVRMRLEDMLYRYYERRTEERFDDEELLNAADEMRSYASILESMMRGFIVDGVSYHAVDSTHAEVIASLDYYTPYRNAITVAKEVHYNDLDFQVTSVAQGAFANSDLAAIVWNPTVALKSEDIDVINNPNMLIYVADASLAPANRDNVIVGNDSTGYMAKNILLTDVTEGNGNFYCPREFKAEMISYTHEYRQTTEPGVARGWETIALPFTVQTIMHEKNGLIAPFGNDASGKHFWLRQLSERGLTSATVIEANTPYLISMPNSNDYPAEYNQAGRVTFSAQDAFVPETQTYGMEMHGENGEMIMFLPCFRSQSADEQVYALNVGEQRGSYAEGSVFVANYRAVRPFEAFTVHHGNGPAPLYIPIFDMSNGTTGVEDVRSKMEDGRSAQWYTIDGRRLQQTPSRKGVYILNGQKTVIK